MVAIQSRRRRIIHLAPMSDPQQRPLRSRMVQAQVVPEVISRRFLQDPHCQAAINALPWSKTAALSRDQTITPPITRFRVIYVLYTIRRKMAARPRAVSPVSM